MSVATARDIIRDIAGIKSLAWNLLPGEHRTRLLVKLQEALDCAHEALRAEEEARKIPLPPEGTIAQV